MLASGNVGKEVPTVPPYSLGVIMSAIASASVVRHLFRRLPADLGLPLAALASRRAALHHLAQFSFALTPHLPLYMMLVTCDLCTTNKRGTYAHVVRRRDQQNVVRIMPKWSKPSRICGAVSFETIRDLF